MANSKFCITAAIALLTLVAALAPFRTASAVSLVDCYEMDRNIVHRAAANECAGRVVSADEARTIREDRARYVRASVTATPPPRPSTIGSGFFVSTRGDVLTNRHVVDSCRRISVLLPDGRTIPAKLRSVSRTYDIALLQTSARPEATAAFASDRLTKGHPVTITGFPMRKLPLVRSEVTPGRYLRQRKGGSDGVMVLAAKVWGGSSGSSVTTPTGAVAGMVFARNARVRTVGLVTPIPPDRAFAIPASALRAFMASHAVRYQSADAQDTPAERYTVRVNCR